MTGNDEPDERASTAGRVGPYKILSRLGAGGMGEVFLALDERLDRRVALKRIRTTGDATPDRRERFRREARLAARLNHPAIVQIYDVLSDGDDEILVFEYVEGATLRRLVDLTPLPPRRVAALGKDIAEGLAEAHRQGIVHRDLKSENVLVTAAGRAKVADFGVAKRQLEGDDLTATGMVVGTTRSMSPEQARGEPADFRSDLFSLGILLYEALGGRSPFAGANQLSTLQRVLHHDPEPLILAVPGVPQGFADLVHRLLAKEPHLRPRSATEVATALSAWAEPSPSGDDQPTWIESPQSRSVTALTSVPAEVSAVPSSRTFPPRRLVAVLAGLLALGGGLAIYFAVQTPPPPLEVAVLAPEIGPTGKGRPEVELLAAAVRDAALRQLGQLEGVAPKAPEEVDAVEGPASTVARAVAATDLIASRLDCRSSSCRLTLRRIRGTDGSLLAAESLDLPVEDLALASHAVASQVARAFPERRPRKGSPELGAESADLAELLRLRTELFAPAGPGLDEVLVRAAALRARAPRFVDAYLLEANAERLAFVRSRERRHLEAAYDRIGEARKIDPESPDSYRFEVLLALAGGETARAARALDGFVARAPGDPRATELGALVANAQGKPREALAKLRAAVHDYPSLQRLRNLALLEAQQGEIAAARAHLGQLLREAPNDPQGLSTLAGLELGSGDPARAEVLYARIVRASPRLVPLTNLGLARMLLGRHGQAAESFEQASRLAPANPLVALNLADALSLLGRRAEATAKYAQVVTTISSDATATDPQYRSTLAQALAHLGRGPEAVEAIQEAIRLAPKNAQVAYEAALVYALLGEESSALTHARRALALGYEPRWFGFPWFAGLRARADFQALLARGASAP
ncbi:MAG TPA: protein kinase [Thermoanaerobaculia bacterium]|nr:protein kinase [Thermoanaerobaculia bacterium]